MLGVTEHRDLPRVFFVKFMVEFVYLYSCLFQSLFACFGQFVDSTSASANVPQLRDKKPVALHAVQEWVERSWPNAIAMMLQLFHHGETKQRLMSCVNQHVDTNQTCEDFSLMC